MHAPQTNKMKQASAASALFFLSLSLWQKEKAGKWWRSNPHPQGPNAAPYGRHTHTEREKGAGCQDQRSGGGWGHGDNKWWHRWWQSVCV